MRGGLDDGEVATDIVGRCDYFDLRLTEALSMTCGEFDHTIWA